MPPNISLQRTRSSALPRSPLTRRPSGRFRRFSLRSLVSCAAVVACACQTIGGHWYWATKKFVATVECSTGAADAATSIRIDVRDQWGACLPGAAVFLTSEHLGVKRESHADAKGLCTTEVEPGAWGVSVRLGGFTEGSQSVDVQPGSTCTVTFFLTVSSDSVPVVT